MPESIAAPAQEPRRPRPWWRPSPAVAILVAFVAGIVGGALAPQFADAIGPFGGVWVRAISALVVPLVVALLVTSVASLADGRAVGRLGVRALIVFLALLAAGSVVVALVTPWLLTVLRVSPTSTASLGGAPLAQLTTRPTLGVWQWVESLVPVNPIAAAANGTLLPLVVFTVAFALAVARLAPESRAYVVGFFRGVADAMLQLVKWVLWTAPAGVFALAYALGARTGFGGAHVLIALLLLVAAVCLIYMAALYAVAVVVGHVPLVTFARALARAQVVGFSSRSSLAALPAMIDAGETRLALPPAVTGFVLPLAVSTFKLGATIAIVTSTLFLGRLYDVPVTSAQLTSVALSAILLSFSVPGIPAGVLLVMVPVLTSVGIPTEGIGIILAMDAIPDMFRTLTNITADMTAAVVVSRSVKTAPT